MLDADELLTSGEVASLLGVTNWWVAKLARRGVIPVARRTPSGRLYYRRDVEPLIAEREAARAAGKPRRGRPRKADKQRQLTLDGGVDGPLSTQPQEQETEVVRSA